MNPTNRERRTGCSCSAASWKRIQVLTARGPQADRQLSLRLGDREADRDIEGDLNHPAFGGE